MQAGVELYRTNHWWYLIYYTPCYAALTCVILNVSGSTADPSLGAPLSLASYGCRTVQDEAVFELLSRASVSLVVKKQ